MADLFQRYISKGSRTETTVWTAKVAAVCAGFISTVILFKVMIIPCIFNLILSTLPSLWISIRGCLSRPFMYIMLNFIIITIAVSSTFQHRNNVGHKLLSKPTPITKLKTQISSNLVYLHDIWQELIHEEVKQADSVLPPDKPLNPFEESLPTSNYPSQILHDPEKVSTEEEEQKENENEVTMDETWRLIMEAQGKVVARHLKKSETWDTSPPELAKKDSHVCDEASDPVVWDQRELKKSETFNDRVSLTREKSMSQDELNRRAEAFIKKINYEMRLQRLESQQRNMQMVNKGV